MPYGIVNEDWDSVISDAKLDRIFKQFIAQNQTSTSFFFCWHTPSMTPQVSTAMTNNGFQEQQHLFWHKTDHYTQTPATSYTSSVEMGTIGFKPHRTAVPFNMAVDARHRHNFIEMPAVTTYEKDDHNMQVNPCQKPPGLSKWIVSNHCPPNSSVLVIGAGAGGDVLGALQAEVNVVAVESDERQYNLLHKIAQEWKCDEDRKLRRDAELSLGISQSKSSSSCNSSSSGDVGQANAGTGSSQGYGTCISCGVAFVHGEITYACDDEECLQADLEFHEDCTGMVENARFCVEHVKKAQPSN